MMDGRGWIERWDELEEKAGPELMPLIIGLRVDMEFFADIAKTHIEMLGLAAKQRQQILDAEAVVQEWAD